MNMLENATSLLGKFFLVEQYLTLNIIKVTHKDTQYDQKRQKTVILKIIFSLFIKCNDGSSKSEVKNLL